MPFAQVYPCYTAKVERKWYTKEQVDEIILWLTGYNQAQLETQITQEVSFKDFFWEAPKIHPKASEITGVICGYRVEDIEDPLMQKIRQLDKLIDELAKWKSMDKILRK